MAPMVSPEAKAKTRMWAAGSDREPGLARASRACLRRGVTLLELLVVVAVMALATAGVGVAIRAGPAAQLEREADRLVALLEAARAASRASGVPVRWTATAEGFRFDGVAPASFPERWLAPGVVVVQLSGQAQPAPAASLLLGPEPVIGAQQVQLTHAEAPGPALRIGTDGLRPFAVQAGP